MSGVQAIVCDFGGVLTSPLLDAFTASQEQSGVTLEQLGQALVAVAADIGENPLFRLERGQMTEVRFLELLAEALSRSLQRPVDLSGFGEHLFGHLLPNEPMIAYVRSLRGRGLKLAICTNNVREWEARWRATLPVDEIFDTVINSAFVGVRKPEPEIYRLTLGQLRVPAPAALLVDDVELNCEAAAALGMRTVWFRDTDQAIREVEQVLQEDQFSTPRRSQQ